MKARIALVAFLLFLFYLPLTKPVFAVTVTIANFPSTITEDSFTLKASISGATTGTNYLRIDLYKDQPTNYFGETFNGSDWYGGSTYSQYLPITIQSGVMWSGSIQGRVGSPSYSQYDSSGTYKLRLRRYTSGGGYTAAEANNSSVAVLISIPTPTPIPTDSPTPTQVSTEIPLPTKTPTPAPTSTKSPTPKPVTPKSSVFPDNEGSKEAVLGESSGSAAMSSKNNSASQKLNKEKIVLSARDDNIGKLFLTLGFIFILACVILFFWSYFKKRFNRK